MRVVLVRHAHSEANAAGLLSGRIPNIHLSSKGVEQAESLAQRIGAVKLNHLRISPMERCFETIHPWLKIFGQNIKPIIDEDLNEVDYGLWSGKKLSSLSRKKEWRTIQDFPSRMYFPEGEGIAHMQERAMRSVLSVSKTKINSISLLVSHGDVIKAILASSLGLHLDQFQRIVIDPASISIIEYSDMKPRVILLNDSRAKVTDLLKTPSRAKNLLGGGAGK